MGEEIEYSHFRQTDFTAFEKRLADETRLLGELFESDALSSRDAVAGYELEAWLIDRNQAPRPENDLLLAYADNPLLTPELARFNFELNVVPERLHGDVLSRFQHSLEQLWQSCRQQANSFGNEILGIGILPTLRDDDLTLENISWLDRYRALNEHVLRLRGGRPIQLNIVGKEQLACEHMDVMLEAASTSMQIHIQIPQAQAVRYYNAALVLSAPMVAISANSPFLFGKQLWQETRIPVFEQSVPAGGFDAAADGPVQRVGFGMDYARNSLFECFEENIAHYPIMLPVDFRTEAAELRHLRLHNGTIWRWNRPLIGFDDDGTPHVRIEHRVCASAPSIIDNIAHLAFFYGLVQYYATLTDPAEAAISFSSCKTNFYAAARHGINTQVDWVDGKRHRLQKLVLDRLLIESETGLNKLGIAANDSKRLLGIIEQRISSGQTGSAWQVAFAEQHMGDMNLLTRTYLANQRNGDPVHSWDLVSC